MKRIFIIPFLLLTVLMLTGWKKEAKLLKSGKSYIDKIYKFKVSPPDENWSIAASPDRKDKPRYVSIKNNAMPFLGISISAQQTTFSDLERYTDFIKKRIKEFNPESLGEKRRYVGGIEAIVITSTFKSLYNIGCYFVKGNFQYAIILSCPKAEIEKHQDYFNKVLENFEFVM